ncbi:MAG: lysophospholipid acyltransferase family protein [Fretibacterium sp.]|nr:lysophospholipid acyltransferase family protein [Fretibacterium sp.]
MKEAVLKGAEAFLVAVLRWLPHGAAITMGGLLGRLLWALSWKKVDRCESRCVLALGVGVTRARAIVKESFENIGRSAAEFIRMDIIKPRLREIMTIEGKEYLDRALARGKGVILMSGHIDNWEMAGARMSMEGYPLVPIYTPQRNQGGINDLIQRQRTDVAGMRMVPSEGAGLREVFKALRSNDIVVILQDLDARRDGVKVPFLGLPASAHDGIVKLHRKFGSPVVPIFFLRSRDPVHHHIIIQDILSDEKDEDGNPFGENMEKSLKMCHNILEGWIRSNPNQWLWLLDRWESTIR